MNILIVSPFFPYRQVPHAGGKHIFELIKALSERHNLYLVSRIEENERVYVGEVEQLCKQVWLTPSYFPGKRSLLNIFIIACSYLRLAITANRVIKAGKFDIVQVENIETGFFIRVFSGSKFFINAHDVISKTYKRFYDRSSGFRRRLADFFLWKSAAAVQKYVIGKFDMTFALSEADMKSLLEVDGELKIGVVPIAAGLDMDVNAGTYDDEIEPLNLLYLAAMHREANVKAVFYFYDEILPLIRKELPGVKWYIVGNRPPERVKKLSDGSNIIVTGFVEDTQEYYRRASVFVSPIVIGGGIIVKNLNAMAIGRPVVTTSYGNEGIRAETGRDIFIADSADDFAKHVIDLLKDRELWGRISKNGREFALENFELSAIIGTLEDYYRSVLKV